jgi:hypothetical protein
MRSKEFKLPTTPITEKTFIRQGWEKHFVGERYIEDDGFDEEIEEFEEDDELEDDEDDAYYWTLPLPKDRKLDPYAVVLTSNATDELSIIREFGLKDGSFIVEIFDSDGLGLCTNEEELEVLYRALTSEEIED